VGVKPCMKIQIHWCIFRQLCAIHPWQDHGLWNRVRSRGRGSVIPFCSPGIFRRVDSHLKKSRRTIGAQTMPPVDPQAPVRGRRILRLAADLCIAVPIEDLSRRVNERSKPRLVESGNHDEADENKIGRREHCCHLIH
jgi:hypothetical protein